MLIGTQTHPRKDILKEIEWIGRNDFDFVDLFMEEDEATPEKNNPEKIKAMLKKYNLQAVGHTAWYLPIGSAIKSIREASIRECEKYLKFFSNAGVECVTINGNWMPCLFSEKECIGFQAETLKKLTKISKNYKLKLVYEPIDTEFDSIKNVSEILKKVKGLALHLDIGHSNLYGRSPKEFIEYFREKIKRVHIHDNDGKTDLHFPIGKGNINWQETIKTLKKYYNGTITIEVFSSKKDKIDSKNKLVELWNNN
jgi:sugar phosphate isomerase/epimerase